MNTLRFSKKLSASLVFVLSLLNYCAKAQKNGDEKEGITKNFLNEYIEREKKKRMQYSCLVRRVMSGNICKEDFRDSSIFLTLDTINAADIFAYSNFLETNNPQEIITSFTNFLTYINPDTSLGYYGENIESVFHDCRNVLYGVFNSKEHSYVLNLWMDKNNPLLIEGITIAKREEKSDLGGRVIYFRPKSS